MLEKMTIDDERVEAELGEKPSGKGGTRTPSQEETNLVKLAVKQYEEYQSAFVDEIQKAKDDIAFVGGDHWTINGKDMKKEREDDGRLAFTKNLAPGFIDNVTGDVRQNMPRISFKAVDSKTDPYLAFICTAAIKHTESISRAHRQYIPAFEQACTGGYPGWVRIMTDYTDSESDNQDILFRFIPSQFGPALDPSAISLDEPGRGGPKWGHIPEDIPWADYVERFPDSSLSSWEAVRDDKLWGCNEKTVTVMSYYRAVPTYDTRYTFADGMKMLKSSAEYAEFKRANQKVKPTKTREFTNWKIEHYLINSREILVGPEPWPGKFIPLIPFEGKFSWDNGVKKYRSVYREAKDANRQANFWSSTITELLADEPYMATVAQIGTRADMWETRNKKKYGVLYYENDPALPVGSKPFKEDNSQKLAGAFQMVAQIIDDIKSLTGIFSASKGETSNETSGRAINARDAQSNTTNFAFKDNGMVAPLEYIAMQYQDLYPKIYDYETTLKLIGEDEQEIGEATINRIVPAVGNEGVENKTVHIITNKKGEIVKKLYADLKNIKFNITVDVGPGFKTQRMEALDQSIRMAQGNPIFAEASVGQAAKMLDYPDAEKIAQKAEFILNAKYPGIDKVGEEDENGQAKIQAAVKQAVSQMEQKIMPGLQAAEQKITQAEQEKAELLQKNADLERKLQIATQGMKDAATKYDIKDQQRDLEFQKHQLGMKMEGMSKSEAGASSEYAELQAQINAIAESLERLIDGGVKA